MKIYALLVLGAMTLAGCGAQSGNSTRTLNNGADTSFLSEGTTSCPGIIESSNPIYERYPLRCGPQQQVIPR